MLGMKQESEFNNGVSIMINRSALAGLLLSSAAIAFSGTAQADFVASTATDWQNPGTALNIDDNNTNVQKFTRSIGAQTIDISTVQFTHSASGNAVIVTTTVNGTDFTSATF